MSKYIDIEKQTKIEYLINNDLWDVNVTPEEYKNSIISSNRKEFIADYSIEDLSKMKLFKLKDYNIGFALKKRYNHITGEYISENYDEASCLHNNESNVFNLGKILIKSFTRYGARYLAYFEIKNNYLGKLYSEMGFEEYHRHQLDPNWEGSKSIISKYGNTDIVYLKYTI